MLDALAELWLFHIKAQCRVTGHHIGFEITDMIDEEHEGT